MKLNELKGQPGSHKRSKRLGRGIGSGKGKTSGKGVKGQKARSGIAIHGFEGGQMPLHMRMPKRGFNNIFAREFSIVNVGDVQKALDAGRLEAGVLLNAEVLNKAGLTSKAKDGIRLLARGELKANVSFEVAHASATAVAAVEKAGGTVKVTGVKAKAPNKGRVGKPAGKRQVRREESAKKRDERRNGAVA
ncbi:50S ribosomal protein L15 [Alphaproteobacteria bacterium SO-S41]|nr:50S ribosomal protein L15 [Alphaproteobacteria bacterium SO-S41]